jgi:hypothetical protein
MTTRWLTLLVAAGCSAGGPAAPAASEASAPPPAPSSQDPAMTDPITTVARAITGTAPISTVAAALGTPVAGPAPDGSRATFVQPSVAGIRRLRLAPLPDGTVHTVRLELATPLAVAALRDRFGAYQLGPPTDLGEPWPVIFPRAIAGGDHDLAVILEVPGPRDQVDRASIEVVTLRVDRRAP